MQDLVQIITTLGDRLIHARKDAGLTQEELARRLGISQPQIQRYERTNYKGASLRRLMEVAIAILDEEG